MTKRTYSKTRDEEAKECHPLLETKLYPLLHKSFQYTINDRSNTHDDLQRGIDYIVKLENGKETTYQERARDGKFRKYQDLLMCWKQPNSCKSEIEKIEADRFIYSYFNKDSKQLLESFVILYCHKFAELIRTDDQSILPFKLQYNTLTGQTAKCFKFIDIMDRMPKGSVYHVIWTENKCIRNI